LFQAAPSEPVCREQGANAGFTLIEALVALAVLAICLAAIGALMAGNIRGSGKIAQHLGLLATLRAVETALPNRAAFVTGTLSGEMHGQTWSVEVKPLQGDFVNPRAVALWIPQTVVITAQSPSGELLGLETVRLAKRTGAQ
jgi:general secretion pathway protein I